MSDIKNSCPTPCVKPLNDCLSIYRGDAVSFDLDLDLDGQALNLDDYLVFFTIKKKDIHPDSKAVVLKDSEHPPTGTSGGITLLNSSEGKARVVLLHNDTKNLLEGTYFYGISVVHRNDDALVYTLLKGCFTVNLDIREGVIPVTTTTTTTTIAPTTQAPTTQAPTTQAPTTSAPTTQAPTTQAPTTQAPTTQAPTTQAPTTQAPTTQAPTTQAPTTQAPTTQAPTTQAPTTQAPTTQQITISGEISTLEKSLASIGGTDYRPSAFGFTDFTIISNFSPLGNIWVNYPSAYPNPDSYSASSSDGLARLEKASSTSVNLEHVLNYQNPFEAPSQGLLAGTSVTFTVQYHN